VSISSELNAALSGLVSGRVYPDIFKQDCPYPAMRYTHVSAVPGATICGSGGEDAADYRIQLDIVAKTGVERDALRTAALAAIDAMATPAVIDSWDSSYDIEAKAYVTRIDILVHPSTPA